MTKRTEKLIGAIPQFTKDILGKEIILGPAQTELLTKLLTCVEDFTEEHSAELSKETSKEWLEDFDIQNNLINALIVALPIAMKDAHWFFHDMYHFAKVDGISKSFIAHVKEDLGIDETK